MDCSEARPNLIARHRRWLAADEAHALDAHLAECAACSLESNVELELDRTLSERLPRRSASDALMERLRSQVAAHRERAKPARRSARRFAWVGAGLCSAALLFAVSLFLRPSAQGDPLAREAVNDHLRMLYAEHAVEVPSGGMHQVKPWFEGKLDFAPVVAFPGDDEFPLQGGSVAYFVDRKAAAYVYKRRLHVITLFVFRSEGLPWNSSAGNVGPVTRADQRGFHALLWRDGDLGYALVSDVDPSELEHLAEKIRRRP